MIGAGRRQTQSTHSEERIDHDGQSAFFLPEALRNLSLFARCTVPCKTASRCRPPLDRNPRPSCDLSAIGLRIPRPNRRPQLQASNTRSGCVAHTPLPRFETPLDSLPVPEPSGLIAAYGPNGIARRPYSSRCYPCAFQNLCFALRFFEGGGLAFIETSHK